MSDEFHWPQGYLSLVLHAHLPFVRHPEHEKFLEESCCKFSMAGGGMGWTRP